MDPILIPKSVCQDLAKNLNKEWVETNRLGGYSSSTIANINTRRYHGLLVAALKPAAERYILLSTLEETVEIEGQKYFMSAHVYPGTVHPKGHEHLIQFSLDPYPVFVYEFGDTRIQKSLVLLEKENTVLISYRLIKSEAPVKLEVRPMTAFRDYHSLTIENPALRQVLETTKGEAVFQPYPALPKLHVYHNAVITDKSGYWYKNFEYLKELERGLDYREDLYSPFALIYSFASTDEVYFCASTQAKQAVDVSQMFEDELTRRAKTAASFPTKDRVWSYLWQSAESFLFEKKGGETGIVAGYPWFGDWGRDTMIALHGILLVQGKYDEAKSVLSSYAHYVNQGIIPNRFPDFGETPEYNTVDASLWYVNAIYEYLNYSDDVQGVESRLFPVIKKIIKFYKEGTHFGIKMDADGLIQAGEGNLALTWMDARVREIPVTPRHGKPVEVNALWYNALSIAAELAGRFEPKLKAEYESLAKKAKESFNALFWCEEKTYLYDVVNGNDKDTALRPNQIFAISLSFPVLDEKKWKDVLRVVEDRLLSPYGLRTLAPQDPDYVGIYEGNSEKRDAAYHQGCVWPWLTGAFVAAYLKAFGKGKEVKNKLRRHLDPVLEHVEDVGLGSISEIFDGDFPHTPRGTVSQAWSVAELLRAYELLKADEIRFEQPKEFTLR